ncbi:glucanotransferase domain of glycogen debranching enzyme-domain-containing protein [Gaertneriomyces semiglobifer]|nr:glucanotransferase domain of glycogen debranching enzyme-domain-containing protein [Gaertneriomyces semiglobifer]
MPVVFTIRLGDDGSPEGRKQYIRLPPPVDAKPYAVRFIITAGAKASLRPSLHTNYPISGKKFVRKQFSKIPFHYDGLSDPTAEINIELPGVFEYYVEYEEVPAGKRSCSKGSGSLVIDPRLHLPNTGYNDPRFKTPPHILLPLDGVSILTVIPKWLPPVSHWGDYFRAFAYTGYNMVHFAPLNTRGSSNSPYSIFDQLSLCDELFDVPSLSELEKEKQLAATLERIRKEYSILSVTDIVWNHTACNSDWLLDHPEAGYNLKTAPHLRAAFEIEEALLEFSENLVAKYGLSTVIDTEEHLQDVLHIVRTRIIPRVRLWEFYIVNVQQSVAQMKELLSSTQKPEDLNRFREQHLAIMPWEALVDLFRRECVRDRGDGTRFAKLVDHSVARDFLIKLSQESGFTDVHTQLERYTSILDEVNMPFYKEHDEDVRILLENITSRARYLRVEPNGPRLANISRENPLVDVYFTRLPVTEKTRDRHPDELALANNGWIWNADPLVNFAAPPSKAYLRREVIAWSDCVKLRYGNGPEDNPWLWQHQISYTQKMARLFNGLRLDNCHSTPVHVAAALLDAAREVNRDLYVFAELFTGSEEKDIMFVSKLGINSLIREAMNAWDPQELSRLAHRYGGSPIGSLTYTPENFPLDILGHDINSSIYCSNDEREIVVDAKGSQPHALFMDCTHDNETPHQKRTATDTLPNAAIVAFANCAVGSVMGYDVIVPELLDIVKESRKYRVPDYDDGILPAKGVLYTLHLKMAREGFSEIHVNQEHDFISIHRMHPVTHDGYLLIARTAFDDDWGPEVHSPIRLRNQNAHVVLSSTLSVQAQMPLNRTRSNVSLRDMSPDGGAVNSLLPPQSPVAMYHSFDAPNPEFRRLFGRISGLPAVLSFSTTMSTKAHVSEEDFGFDADIQSVITCDPERFEPASIVVFRTSVIDDGLREPGRRVDGGLVFQRSISEFSIAPSLNIFTELWRLMGMDRTNSAVEMGVKLGWDVMASGRCWYDDASLDAIPPGLWDCVKELSMVDINTALYRCGTEEQDTTGDSVYNVPGHGPLAYCGLQGFVSVLGPVARNNDLGHPIFSNLRNGPWMIDYVLSRLRKHLAYYPALTALYEWLSARLEFVKRLSPSFSPKYFTLVLCSAYQALRLRALMLSQVRSVTSTISDHQRSSLVGFANAVALMTYQLYGRVPSTGLLPQQYANESIEPHRGPAGSGKERGACLAAGLPHFASQYMRCWGRDIFISLPGALLALKHFDVARAHLIAFGSTLRHGLIPNLLDQGICPRYNARDAAWWWLYAVGQYCRSAPEGFEFLGQEVLRRFVPRKRYRSPDYLSASHEDDDGNGDTYCKPDDTSKAYVYKNTMAELCHEILERHAYGLHFREWNAGPALDHAMRPEGFDVNAFVDWNRGGFIFGGNRWNCGTWMDKMGDSAKAGNKGMPATPRDGAAVEIAGLAKATLKWVAEEVIQQGQGAKYWPWKSVEIAQGRHVKYVEWNRMLQDNFEKWFYIPLDSKDDASYAIDNPQIIHRRGMYKDCVAPSLDFMGPQLRPNCCMAMAVAPEMFNPDHARIALDQVKDTLVGPLGMKTLDPDDWAYRGYYDNSNDSTDSAVAHGFNYHQGPEWVYPLGFFLRAYLYFNTQAQGHDPSKVDSVYAYVQRVLMRHKLHILDGFQSPYAGLPELTNKDGEYCNGSCATQAWSGAVMLELISDLAKGANS